MPTYITLMRFTKQGIQNIKESPDRLDAARAAIEAAGGKIIGYYMTMGQYDAVIITEGPDDETTTKILLATGAQGNVRTETLRAFTEEEARRIIEDMP